MLICLITVLWNKKQNTTGKTAVSRQELYALLQGGKTQHIRFGTRYSSTALPHGLCTVQSTHSMELLRSCYQSPNFQQKSPLILHIPRASFPILSSFHWTIPILLPSTFNLIYLFLLIYTEDCRSPCSLERVELCRLQIKHCVYLHFFRRFTISFYTKSQVKPPNLMVCVITWVKQSSDCWLCPAHVIRISAIPLCQVNTTD